MKKHLRNSFILGLTAVSIALGGASVMAEDEKVQKGERKFASLEAGSENGTAKNGRGGWFMESAEEGGFGMRIKMRTMDFSTAVDQGIISQETADKITEYYESETETKKAELDSFKNSKKEDRDTALSEGQIKMERKDLFEELLSAGIITQTEADSLKASMPNPPELSAEFNIREKGFALRGMNTDVLIEKGIIDSETAEKMTAYMEEKFAEKKAELEARSEELRAEMESKKEELQAQMEAVRNMTQEERKEFFEDNRPVEANVHFDILSELIDEGIITQEQADAIKELTTERGSRTKPGLFPDENSAGE